ALAEEQRVRVAVRRAIAIRGRDLGIGALELARERDELRALARDRAPLEARLLERRRQRVRALGMIEPAARAPARERALDAGRPRRGGERRPPRAGGGGPPRGREQEARGDRAAQAERAAIEARRAVRRDGRVERVTNGADPAEERGERDRAREERCAGQRGR